MTARGKPPWTWARIVKACAGPAEGADLLTPTEKLVYCEFHGLCFSRKGAIIGAGGLARRLGLSARTVERARLSLVTLGLLERHDRGAGRMAGWMVTLPEICRPNVRRLDDEQVEELANRLAHSILRKRAQTTHTGDGTEQETPHLAVV